MTGIFPIEADLSGRLAIAARPRGGDWLENDIEYLKIQGVEVLVSLLESSEAAELGLLQEPATCDSRSLEFMSFPIQDRGVPESLQAFHALAENLARLVADGRSIAIHCRAGLGRAPLTVAGVLVRLGCPHDTAWELVASARGLPVPDTPGQREWLLALATPDHPSPARARW